MKTVLFCLLVLLGLVSIGSALRCYKCNSHKDKECTEMSQDSKNRYLAECNDDTDKTNYTICRKLHMFMDQDFGEENPAEDRVHRDCGETDNQETGKKRGDCYYKSGYNTRTWTCSCKEDECNTATSLFTPNVAICTLLIPSVVFYLRNLV